MKKNVAVKQTPRERLIPGNRRVIAPSGRTTWLYKSKGEFLSKLMEGDKK